MKHSIAFRERQGSPGSSVDENVPQNSGTFQNNRQIILRTSVSSMEFEGEVLCDLNDLLVEGGML
jgi:hypothetical protein